MAQQYDFKAMASKVRALRRNALALKEIGGDIPAVEKNSDRLIACIRMLEININDIVRLQQK